MNGMYTVDIETAKKIERMRKILAPLLIAALIISGLFVPKMNVKAADIDKFLTINFVPETGHTVSGNNPYASSVTLKATSEDPISVNFSLSDSVNTQGLAFMSKYVCDTNGCLLDKFSWDGDKQPNSSGFDFSVGSEVEFDIDASYFQGTNTTTSITLTLKFRTYPTILKVFAEASGTDNEVIAPVLLDHIVTTADNSGYPNRAVFKVTLDEELVPTEDYNHTGICEFSNKWRDSDPDNTGLNSYLTIGTENTVYFPLENLLGDTPNAGAELRLDLEPVIDKINLPVSFATREGAKVLVGNEEKDSPYKTKFSTTETIYMGDDTQGGQPVSVTEYYAVHVTLPNATTKVDNSVFTGWRFGMDMQAYDDTTGNYIFRDDIQVKRTSDDSFLLTNDVIYPGTEIIIYYPAVIATDGGTDGHRVSFEAEFKRVPVNYEFSTSSNIATVATSQMQLYPTKYDFDKTMYVYDIPLPEVTITDNSGAICRGYEMNSEDYSNYTPWLADYSSPVSGMYDAGETLSIGFFPQDIGDGGITVHFEARIGILSDYPLRIVLETADSASGADTQSITPVETISGGGLKYSFTLPDISDAGTIGMGWKYSYDEEIEITRADGTELYNQDRDGIAQGETIYLIVDDYRAQHAYFYFHTVDGFICSDGNYDLTAGTRYFLTSGTWKVGSDGYRYEVPYVCDIYVSQSGTLTFKK